MKWLAENNIDYHLIDIVESPPNKEILLEAMNQLVDRKKLFNTSGASYRNLGSKVVQAMSDHEVLMALASDGKLIIRPFLISRKSRFLVGFKPEIWKEVLLK